VKKTKRIKVQDIQYHLVSYYSLDDVTNLPTPRDDYLLKDLRIRKSLLYQPHFRNYLDDDGTWSLAGSMAPNIPVVPSPQYDPFGRLYLIPQYQVSMREFNLYQCDQYPFPHTNHALQYPTLQQTPSNAAQYCRGNLRVNVHETQP